MSSAPGRYFIWLLLSTTLTLSLRAEEPTPVKQSVPAKANENKGEGRSSRQGGGERASAKPGTMLPADAVIILCDQANETLDLLPKAVILRPEKYQELLDQIDKLKKQIENPKNENAVPPTRCFLRGKVEAGAVRLEAEFSGTAERADTLVSLACSQAGASSAQTDGHMAQIRRSNTGGFLVRLDKAGEYHVKLDLLVPLVGREGSSRGFELTLPRAVITQLELDLPSNCTDVRLGGQLLKDLQLPGLELKNNHLRGSPGLGPVDKLDLSWKEARPSVGEPLRIAEGRIQARLDAVGLTTQADLSLTAEGAPTKVWRLLVPRNAEIKVLASDKEAPIEHRMETDDKKYAFASLRTIYLKEARSDPLHVQVKSPLLPLSPRGSAMPIGPFFVFDAARQTGTVLVRNQVRSLHLDYRGHGDMQLRRLETEESKGDVPATVATLVYSNIPLVEGPTAATGPQSLSWLDLEAVRVPVQMRMRVSHTLTLHKASSKAEESSSLASQRAYWHVTTTIAPATKWADVEPLKIFVPPNWEPADENVLMPPTSPPRWVTVPSALLREAPTQAQRLEGRYKASYKAEEHAVLKLPQPQGTIESCEVKIEAPADVEVVLNNVEQSSLELTRQPRPNEQTWRCRGVLGEELGIDVSWRPYRPELRVTAVVDLTLNGHRGEVRHELRLQLPPTPPSFVTLRVPAILGDTLHIQDEQGQDLRSLRTESLADEQRQLADKADKPADADRLSPGRLRLPVPTKESGKEWRLLLHYTTRLGEKDRTPRKGEPLLVPLVTLEQATTGDFKVRIWSEPGFLPRVASPRWEEQSIEEVKDRALPMLVLRTAKFNTPLRLVLSEQAAGFSALVERALMRVQLEEGGTQRWQASFRLRQITDRHLDLLMPAPVVTLNAQFSFNGHKVIPVVVNDQGENSGGGAIARLHLPPLGDRQQTGNANDNQGPANPSSILEVFFQSPPGRSSGSPLHTTLQPPQILRATGAPICWQVSLPPNRVLLAPESAPGVERIWTRRGWLLLAAELSVPPEWRRDYESAALVCWQAPNVPIVLTHAPQLAWLLVCSLGLSVVGLGLYGGARVHGQEGSRLAAWFWPLLILFTLAIAIAVLFRPTLLFALIYGCEPGAVVLLAVVGVQWLMHQRYRRQIVFLPSFSRGRAGSSLIRKSPSPRPPSGEPSTVDAPPPHVG
jgi:hypothetical protein